MTFKQSAFALLGAFLLGAILAAGVYRVAADRSRIALAADLKDSRARYTDCLATVVRVGNRNAQLSRKP